MISEPYGSAIEWITGAVVAAIERGESVEADALRFLLRRYLATDRADLQRALEPALARALDRPAIPLIPVIPLINDTIDQLVAWLSLFSEAAALSDDDRLRTAGAELIARLRQDWGCLSAVEGGVASVNACLAACHLVDPQSVVPDAIDELERIVAAAYRPGQGLARSVGDPGGGRGHLADHVRTASALLTAYDFTGRLPYPMLAEELMQFARQTLWDGQTGAFLDSTAEPRPSFAINCDAARVLCRLAALHSRSDYRAAAVLASDADYLADAARILATCGHAYRERGPGAAVYGLALTEWPDRS